MNPILDLIRDIPDLSHTAFESEEWAPLVSRLRVILDRIMDIPAPGKNMYLTPTVHVMKLMSQARKAFEQGELLTDKISSRRLRLDKAAKDGNNAFYHVIWNELTVYMGMADMYAHYYTDNADEVDQVLSAMEVMLFMAPPSV